MVEFSGYVAIVGRPNVGKSTLLNHLLGQKISIVAQRPQTTRHCILGIKTTPTTQAVYVDTPGIHKETKKAINRYLNRAAKTSMLDVDVVVFVLDRNRWTDEDDIVLAEIERSNKPVIAVVNKVDLIKDKGALLPYLGELQRRCNFVDILPLSAFSNKDVKKLEECVKAHLPKGDLIFPEDQITDKSVKFLTGEIIREKLFRRLGQELPYNLAVEIEQFSEQDRIVKISAVIWVERKGQKAIVIGKKGALLKTVGSESRVDLEKMLDKRVHIELWVKVKEGWSNSETALKSFGYYD